jgi:hypothetical protein
MTQRKFTPAQQALIDARKAKREEGRHEAFADMLYSLNDSSPDPVYSEEETAARAIAHRLAIDAANAAYAIANAPQLAEVARMVAMIDASQTYYIGVSGWGTDGFVQITSFDGKVSIQIPHGKTHTNHKGYKMSAEKAIEVIEMNIGEKFHVGM